MTDREKLIEAMARAIHDADDTSDTAWPEHEGDDGHRGGNGYIRICRWPELFRAQAGAALTALEATHVVVSRDLCHAVLNSTGELALDRLARAEFKAMIGSAHD